MLTSSRRTLTSLMAGAALAAPALGTTLLRPAVSRATIASSAAPSLLSATEVVAQITGADGIIRFDIAEDGKRFIWDKPVFDDGLPAHGSTYISQGYIYPEGTLSDEVDGVNADGSPEFPDQVLGQWSCYGWYIGDGAHATEGPWVLSTQLYQFGKAWGEATLTSEGYVLSQTGGTVRRAVTGGTGPFAGARGDLADTNLGFNETEGGNARYAVMLAAQITARSRRLLTTRVSSVPRLAGSPLVWETDHRATWRMPCSQTALAVASRSSSWPWPSWCRDSPRGVPPRRTTRSCASSSGSIPTSSIPRRARATNELDILALIYEGLTRIDEQQQTVPAAAESWEYNADATQITFHLRQGLTYSDGSPLTAENFRYAAERTCDPATAGGYQSILFVVAGCAEFAGLATDAQGQARDYTAAEHEAARAALGVRALDDLTLQIDFTQPVPYFHTIAFTWVFFPVKQAIVEARSGQLVATAENHIGNGPFTVTPHRPRSTLVLHRQRPLPAGPADAGWHRVHLCR